MMMRSDLEAAVLRGAAVGVARVDDGAIIYATPLLEAMFGYTTRGALTNGRHVEDLVPPVVREKHLAHRQRYADNPSARPMGVGLSTYGQRRDGSCFPVVVSLYSEVVSGVVCAVFCVTDMTNFSLPMPPFPMANIP